MAKDASADSGGPSAAAPPASNPSNSNDKGTSAAPSNSNSAAPDTFLLQLREACERHRLKHERHDGGQSEDWCGKELGSFARVLPRMEATISARDTQRDEYANGEGSIGEGSAEAKPAPLEELGGDDTVSHLFALYRSIARGEFCPRAVRHLFADRGSTDGEGLNDSAIARGILPRIAKLLQYASSDPVAMALSPLKQRPSKRTGPGEATEVYHRGESIGSTVAALLNVLHDENLRLAAVRDLINLSNDLSTIDDSGALFDPPIPSLEEGRAGKIRVHIFTELARSSQDISNDSAQVERHVVPVPSRRSLLALQCVVWTALRGVVPQLSMEDDANRTPLRSFSVDGQTQRVALLNSLMSSSRSTSLLSLRPHSEDRRFLAWTYSPSDLTVHSLLMLRTKLTIAGLFTEMVESGMETSKHGTLALATSVDVALLAVDAAKYHLLWGHRDEETGASSPSARKLERHLRSLASWAVSKFVALALVFPDSASRSEIWPHSFCSLLDCLPLLAGPSNGQSSEDECLRRMVVRAIHVMLSNTTEPASNQPGTRLDPSNVAASFIRQFRVRCIARGYFAHLIELVKHSPESISGPALSIAAILLDHSSDSEKSMVESACGNALGAFEACEPNDSGREPDTSGDSPLIRLGNKRRRLEPSLDAKEPLTGASMLSVLACAVTDALADAQIIEARLAKGNQHNPVCGGPEIVSFFSESDARSMGGVAGVLRLLLSMHSHLHDAGRNCNSTGKVISYLLQCFKRVADVLSRQKSENNKLMHVEPKLFTSLLSSIVSVGLHACRVQPEATMEIMEARDSLSHCAIAALPVIDSGSVDLDDENQSSRMLERAITSELCGGICCRLASIVGAVEKPYSGACLCRWVGESQGCLAVDAGAFVCDDLLPLHCRCVFLSMMSPVASESEDYEPTLSSIRCILADAAQAPVVVRSALVGLPTLFLSLATLKGGSRAARAQYLATMIASFNTEDLVVQHAKSDISGIQSSAMLSLARIARMYTAASLAAAEKGDGSVGGQVQSASAYLFQHLSPKTNGIPAVVASLLSLDGAFAFTASDETHFHSASGLPLLSKEDSSLFCIRKGQSRWQWMANLVYLQSLLALMPESALRSSGVFEFFSDGQHYGSFDQLAKELNGVAEADERVSVYVPPPALIFLLPFFSHDQSTQESAARAFGQILLCNGCRVLSAFFVPEGASLTNEESNEATTRAVDRLFSEIDFLLRRCGLGQDILFSRQVDFQPGKGAEDVPISGAALAVNVFSSLYKSSPKTAFGDYIRQRSLLALVRIWVASSDGHAFDSDIASVDEMGQSSLASSAFDRLSDIFKSNERRPGSLGQEDQLQNVDRIMPKIFGEFLLPPTQSIPSTTRYRLLSVFIGAFLLPSSADKSLPRHNIEALNVFEILQFINEAYPSIIVFFVKEEDHEAIQMCTAFRMHLLREATKANREEERVQKKNLQEVVVGSRQDNQRSGSRSLVPGERVSTAKLLDNTKLLCTKITILSHVIPRLLLHPGRAPLRFFTTKVCQSGLDYPAILKEIGLTVLKALVWELGGDDPDDDDEEAMYHSSAVENGPRRKDVLLALAKGYLLKEGGEEKLVIMSPSQGSTSDDALCASTAGKWVAPNFMYLLINMVINKWPTRSERDKFRVVKCLKEMMKFLPPSESPKYMPQIMTVVNRAISGAPESATAQHSSKLRFIAVATLFDFVKIVASVPETTLVEENLTTIVVSLFPLFDESEHGEGTADPARRLAVQMLEWLASGEANKDFPQYFSDVPFLPMKQELKGVRRLLVEKGVHLDAQQDGAQGRTVDAEQLETNFYNRMNTLSRLITSHENKNVRKVAIKGMTDLIKANRELFHKLVVNEELSSMNFLTVVHASSPNLDSSSTANVSRDADARLQGGFVTQLLVRVLSRCVDESNRGIRDAISSLLGEIGAIDPSRVSKINSSQFSANSGSGDSGEWRLANPPWKTPISDYQVRLVTRHLVSGLKSALSSQDQAKISFAIQEGLVKLDAQFGGGKQGEMSPTLQEKLQQADVMNVVEPFWKSSYKQKDLAAQKSPPFFAKSKSYFAWLSSFCQFIVARSNQNRKSEWKDLFYANRSAIRSQAGIGVAEFLLPLLVLDAICFGDKSDEDAIVNEFLHALSFESDGAPSLMSPREREMATNAVFTVMEVLRHWMEKEVESRHRSSKGRSKRTSLLPEDGATSWPATKSIQKIERLLGRIPLSTCAIAASRVGMNARAMQFLEMDGRQKALVRMEASATQDNNPGAPKFLNSHYLEGTDSQLAQTLLGELNDFDTMVFVAQKSQQTDLTKRLAEEASEREMYEDWLGSFRAYEQLLDSRLASPNSTADDSKFDAQKGLLRCLLKLGRLDSVLNQAYGMSKQGAQGNTAPVRADLLPFAVEASWRLGNWSILDNLVTTSVDESTLNAGDRFQLALGRTMNSLHSRSQERFDLGLQDSREHVMLSLATAARDGYARSYPYLTQLHALREIEDTSRMLFDGQSNFQQAFTDAANSDQWRDRLQFSAPDITGSNAIINARLALSRMADQPIVEGAMWLDIGKAARKGGLYQVAENSLTQANVSFCKVLSARGATTDSISSSAREAIGRVNLQVAKLKHDIGESMTALKLIEDGVPASIFLMDEKQLKSYVANDASIESGETLGRRVLQATEWMVCDGLKSSAEIKERYSTVLKLAPNWERAHFHYAKFLDSMFESRLSSADDRAKGIGKSEVCQEYLISSIQHYGMALQLGQKHVYQALPRMLAMWLEFTDEDVVNEGSGDQNARLRENQVLVNKAIKSFASKIPEHLFYTALPQLISRVEHKNAETSKNVALILRTVLAKYPRQALWSCGWLRFSKSEDKKKTGDEIFHGASKMLRKSEKGKPMHKVLMASRNLFSFMISLAQFVPKGNHSQVKMKVPSFDTELSSFIPPVQAALSLSPGALEQSGTADVFPSFVPRMRAFNPELKIMQSKAKPKKVSIFAVPSSVAQRDKSLSAEGSPAPQDAGEMHFLVKQEAKGDLRKDSRVQDLNNVINRLFAGRKGSSDHRRRLRLQLRTFSVVCLAEDCGILEWVPSTESLRSVITETYNPQVDPKSVHRRGSRITNFNDAELRNAFIKCQDVYFKKGDLEMATKKFDELILKQYLPVMYWWFVQNFSKPQSWFEARTNFTLSTAVWSAVGHIIGLGDRHSENILIDTSSGDCVHVDFDCIFDKGLNLPRPEVIPFRLTPNMLDAFGPTGADGLYTGALTESMRTLRKNRDTLLSVLEPFLNDPVINFKSKSQKSKEEKEARDAKTAKASMEKIKGRLDGEYNLQNPNHEKMKGKAKEPRGSGDSAHITKLSVEGQVQKMIMEATSHENLVQVYVGWMPWI